MKRKAFEWISEATAEEVVRAFIVSRGVVFESTEQFLFNSSDAKKAIEKLENLEAITDELKRILNKL